MVGRDVVGHVVQDQPHAAGGQRRTRRGEPRWPAEARVRHVSAHTVRRADDVLGRTSGSASWNDSSSPGLALASASPAGLRSHTPISLDTVLLPLEWTASQP